MRTDSTRRAGIIGVVAARETFGGLGGTTVRSDERRRAATVDEAVRRSLASRRILVPSFGYRSAHGAGGNTKRGPESGIAAVVALGAALAACAQHTDALAPAADDCRVEIVVAFARDVSADGVAEIARAAGVRLDLVRTIMPTLQVLSLEAAGGDAACAAGIERLRAVPDVRSVDRDAQRRIHER